MKTVGNILRLFTFLATLAPVCLYAANLSFGSVQKSDRGVQVNLSVGSYQRHDILEAMKRGMEIKLVYEIQIRRTAGGLFSGDRVVYSRMIVRKAKFDFWGKAFQVMEDKRSLVFQSENAMLDHLFSLRDYELSSSELKQDEDYVIRGKAELKSVKLYFPMNLIFKYLVGFWDFNTGWVSGPVVRY